jgi:hypothetical protein
MNDVLARAACDLKDDSRHQQGIAKEGAIERPLGGGPSTRKAVAVQSESVSSRFLTGNQRHPKD